MGDRECLVDACEGLAKRRGMCTKHYQRWLKYGDTGVFRPDAKRGCVIAGCDKPHYGRGWCQMHWARWKKTGDPLGIREHFSPLTGMFGDLNRAWVGDAAGYEAVHARLRKDLGPASAQTCAHCGGSATDWAYDNEDPDEQISSAGLWYSVKGNEHYLPLCRSCHRTFDNESCARREGRASALHATAA